MNLYLFDDDNIITFNLPAKKIGNFWMTDNNQKNIINISGEDNKWIISGSLDVKIISSEHNDNIILKYYNYYIIEKNNKRYVLYCDKVNDDTFECFNINDNQNIKIGKNESNDISVNIPYFSDLQMILSIQNGNYVIQKAKDSLVYCNNKLIKEEQKTLKYGDVINTFGLKIVLIKNAIFINRPFKALLKTNLPKKEIKNDDSITDEEIENKKMYEDNDYFLISPRMRNIIETLNMRIDSPPTRENMQETPLIMTLAPMLTMAASSMLTLSSALQAVSAGEKTMKQVTPTLIISGAMIFSMFVWPFVTRAYEKRQKEKRERNRQEKYKAYLNKKDEELMSEFTKQKKTLEESLVSNDVCYDSIVNKRRTLWQRRIDQGDFLTVRIGKGNVPFDVNISYQSEEFTMDDDNLKKMLEELISKYKTLDNVPVGYSFTKNYLTAVNGIYPKYINFLNNVFLQLMDFHNYHDLKIVVFTNKSNEKKWNYLKESPYCFSNDKSIRFFATNTEEMQKISDYLSPRFLNRREYNNNNEVNDFSKYSSYYLILVDDIDSARKIDIINSVLEEKRNLGYSIIIAEEKLSKIPSEVSKFITIGESVSVVLNSENNNQIRFNDEINDKYDMNLVSKTLLNTPLYLDDKNKELPSVLTFLEMFSVGKIEQLNVLNRWKDNNPVKSLKTEVGVNENGDLFIVDIHEKAHGPHGLIAGMTGSGKSEFIITYILSMAINYSPEEVSFVLIDYKGGGLAGAFVNSETGIKLPHIVGTITNLDKNEINRALSSIQSELRRRQEKFNEVRDKLGESTIDIYKYQKLYRDGIINEPIPHLIIVCDEFAELKSEQPDFMEDLISTARIGRSLGVHLILATQKPSGVVDAQIWSNARFKICLKVQDKSDSMEMIKTDDAAELKNVGRFYLLVGYNEYYALGQAAWAGAGYFPNKEFKKPVDKNLYFIDNVGEINKSINNSLSKRFARSEGEELTNIVKYLIDICSESNYKIKSLWLDRLNNIILLNNLFKKYNYAKKSFNINPIVGEYDDPYNQIQGLLTLNIGELGNAIIYGNAESGKDEFLSTFVYSCLMTYDTSELNLYLLDFGAETLQNFENAPQVGNVILNGDDEKLENLAKMLFSEMNKRKKLFTSFNGNYDDYIKLSGKTLPNIVVVINNIEVLNEVNPDYVDKITQIIRDGSKYGINFVITTTSATTVKFKIAQSCKQTLCLQMKNESDYRDILGKTNGIVPSNYVGRGLAKLDRVVEFQTASISKDSSFNEIKSLVNLLNEKGINKAKPIPVMPDLIEADKFISKYTGLNSVPLGITKETLNAYLYDYSKNVINLVSSNDFDNMKLFINNFSKVLELNNTFNTVIVDANNYFDTFNYKLNYVNNKFNEFIDSIKNIDNQIKEILVKSNMNLRSISNVKNTLIVIIGFDKFLNKLDDEHKNMFKEILNSQKEILKITFVFIDVPSSFKKYEYEEWYKNNVNNTEGVWIGNNITNQYVIKLSIQPNGISTIENDYLVVVKNGMPTIVKMINEVK